MQTPEHSEGRHPWARVIVVNYNGGALIEACLAALAAQTMADFEAVIVDNASTDGSADARLPDERFRVIRNGSNVGFAEANNIGARGSRATWIATLNPDTEVSPDWLAEMRRGTERFPDVRVFGATLVHAADPTRVDGFGDVLSIAGIPWRGGHGQAVAELPDEDCEVFAPCAAAALYHREAFEAAGGFDDAFFCYVEDVDLGFRLRLLGERCMQVRHAIVRHHGSATTGRLSAFSVFHSFRNRLWMLKKDMPAPLLVLAAPTNVLCSVAIIAARHRTLPVRAALKGLWCGITQASGPGDKRRPLQRDRRISTRDLIPLLAWNPAALHHKMVRIVPE